MGVFSGEDAFDYYGSGDVFPDPVQDPFKLMLSGEETYGHFLVLVPPLGVGDFGAFVDEGPIFLLPSGTFVDGAVGEAFLDGSATTADALYASIHSTVDTIRAGGVKFTIVKIEVPTDLLTC